MGRPEVEKGWGSECPEERGETREAEIEEAREWMFLEKRMAPGFIYF